MTPYDLSICEHAAQALGYDTIRMGYLGATAVSATGPIPGPSAARIEAHSHGEPPIREWNPLLHDEQSRLLRDALGIKAGLALNGVARAQLETPDEDMPYAVFEESVICQVPETMITDEHSDRRAKLLAEAEAAYLRRVVVRAAAHLVSPDPNVIRSSPPL